LVVFKYVPIFVNFVQLDHFLLTPFKSLTTMNIDWHVSFHDFFFYFIFFILFLIFLDVHVSTQ